MLPDQQIDEFLKMLAKSPTNARDMVRGLFAAHEAKAAPAVPQGWKPIQAPITEEMHAAAVKVLIRANGMDGLPQRMLDAMLAATPAAPSQEPGKCAQCKKPYRKGADTKGCPKCAPGVYVPESEFQKPISAPSQEPVTLTDEQALKDAFVEGYCARSTYNDVDTSDFETEWAKSSARAALREKGQSK